MGAKSEGIEEMKVVMLVTAQQQLHVSLEQSIVHFSKHKYKHTHTHIFVFVFDTSSHIYTKGQIRMRIMTNQILMSPKLVGRLNRSKWSI